MQYILKHSDFSQAIHVFFSSQKNVNLKREILVPLERDSALSLHAAFLLHEAVKAPSASALQIFG